MNSASNRLDDFSTGEFSTGKYEFILSQLSVYHYLLMGVEKVRTKCTHFDNFLSSKWFYRKYEFRDDLPELLRSEEVDGGLTEDDEVKYKEGQLMESFYPLTLLL